MIKKETKQISVEMTEQVKLGLKVLLEKLSRSINTSEIELRKSKIVIKDGEIVVI